MIMLVRNCFKRKLYENFQNFLTVRTHEQNTRNNRPMLEIQIVELRVTKFSFWSMGVKIYNDLPIQN